VVNTRDLVSRRKKAVWCPSWSLVLNSFVSDEGHGRNKKTNEEMLRAVETRQTYRELERWMGHVLQLDCLVRTVLEGRLHGKKKGRGRPRKMQCSWLLKTKEGNMDYAQLKQLVPLKTDQIGVNENGNLSISGQNTIRLGLRVKLCGFVLSLL